MNATIGLEWVGWGNEHGHKLHCVSPGGFALAQALLPEAPSRRPWVARIMGTDETYGFARDFVKPKTDYRLANSKGTRGVTLWYVLPPGLYEVSAWHSWRGHERYFVLVGGAGEVDRISDHEAREMASCLSAASA